MNIQSFDLLSLASSWLATLSTPSIELNFKNILCFFFKDIAPSTPIYDDGKYGGSSFLFTILCSSQLTKSNLDIREVIKVARVINRPHLNIDFLHQIYLQS